MLINSTSPPLQALSNLALLPKLDSNMDKLTECLSEDEQAWSSRQALHQMDSAPSKPVDWGYHVRAQG